MGSAEVRVDRVGSLGHGVLEGGRGVLDVGVSGDHADAQAVGLDDGGRHIVAVTREVGRVRHVGREHREGGVALDAEPELGRPPVELVIAEHGDVDARGRRRPVARVNHVVRLGPAQQLVEDRAGVVIAPRQQQHGFVGGGAGPRLPHPLDHLRHAVGVAALRVHVGHVIVHIVEMHQPQHVALAVGEPALGHRSAVLRHDGGHRTGERIALEQEDALGSAGGIGRDGDHLQLAGCGRGIGAAHQHRRQGGQRAEARGGRQEIATGEGCHGETSRGLA